VLKTGHNFDGDSLSYLDMMERNNEEERRKVIITKYNHLTMTRDSNRVPNINDVPDDFCSDPIQNQRMSTTFLR
jgi:hypothetical protein